MKILQQEWQNLAYFRYLTKMITMIDTKSPHLDISRDLQIVSLSLHVFTNLP